MGTWTIDLRLPLFFLIHAFTAVEFPLSPVLAVFTNFDCIFTEFNFYFNFPENLLDAWII